MNEVAHVQLCLVPDDELRSRPIELRPLRCGYPNDQVFFDSVVVYDPSIIIQANHVAQIAPRRVSHWHCPNEKVDASQAMTLAIAAKAKHSFKLIRMSDVTNPV